MRAVANKIDYEYTGLDEAFPKVDPLHAPYGALVLVQIRVPKFKTKGGLKLTDESREIEYHNTQTAKVIALGPLAFKRRDDMAAWPEGPWCEIGDFIRVPKYGGDRWGVPYARREVETDPQSGRDEIKTIEDYVIFGLFRDLDLRGKITGDPLKIRAFLNA